MNGFSRVIDGVLASEDARVIGIFVTLLAALAASLVGIAAAVGAAVRIGLAVAG